MKQRVDNSTSEPGVFGFASRSYRAVKNAFFGDAQTRDSNIRLARNVTFFLTSAAAIFFFGDEIHESLNNIS
jgi:hypothetical protein